MGNRGYFQLGNLTPKGVIRWFIIVGSISLFLMCNLPSREGVTLGEANTLMVTFSKCVCPRAVDVFYEEDIRMPFFTAKNFCEEQCTASPDIQSFGTKI